MKLVVKNPSLTTGSETGFGTREGNAPKPWENKHSWGIFQKKCQDTINK
jgi:hypothetical protein